MTPWTCKTVHCFPKAVATILFVGMAVVFIIALLRGDVSPYVPFISETGAKPPESGIFSLFLDISASVGIATIVLRFMIVEECNESMSKLISVLNKLALLIGIISMLGMKVVAAYPMLTVPSAHNIGALTLFSGSLLYGLLQTVISYKMYPTYVTIFICRTRLVLTVLGVLSFVSMFVVGTIGRRVWEESSHSHWTGKKNPDDEGFNLMLSSAVFEWTIAFVSMCYFLTFVNEFSKIIIHLNVRKLMVHFDEEGCFNVKSEETSPLI